MSAASKSSTLMSRPRLISLTIIALAVVVFNLETQVAKACGGLMDVEWVLTAMEEIGGDETAVLESGKYTISFEPNLVVVGQCDCNDYSAEYVLSKDNALEIRKLVNTEAACSPTTKCWGFLEGLQSASALEIQDDVLRIYYEDKRVLKFRARNRQADTSAYGRRK